MSRNKKEKNQTPHRDVPGLDLSSRSRRNRKSPSIRKLVRETTISADDLIYPLFIHDKDFDEEISSMPGCKRLSIEGLIKEVKEASDYGIGSIMLFPSFSVGNEIITAFLSPIATKALLIGISPLTSLRNGTLLKLM